MSASAILRNIPIFQISVADRARENYGDIEELKGSIQEHGLIQPIAVLELEDGTFQLLAGGRRTRACIELGFDLMPAHCYKPPLDEIDIKSIELAENIHRLDMTFVERAKLIDQIHELQTLKHGKAIKSSEGGHSQEDTANIVHLSRATVTADLELARAMKTMPELAEAKDRKEALKIWNKRKEEAAIAELSDRLAKAKASTPLEVKQKALVDSYIIGDFFKRVAEIPDNSIHLCEIDPPYGIDLIGQKKLESESEQDSLARRYNEIDASIYAEFLSKVVKECYRVLFPNGWILMWFAPNPWFETVYSTLAGNGFTLRRMPAIWNKEGFNGQTMSPDFHLANCYEMFFYARKGMATINTPGRSNVFSYGPVSPNNKIHPTERPIEMIEDVLQTFCAQASRILVPFAGSGNTILAADNLNMTATGFDLCSSYKDYYTKRIYESIPGRYKSYA